jgi:hypothetical protein
VAADRLGGCGLGQYGIKEAGVADEVIVSRVRSDAEDNSAGRLTPCSEPSDSLGVEGGQKRPVEHDDARRRSLGDPILGKLRGAASPSK